MAWEEMQQYNIDLIEQSAGIDTVKELLEAAPHEYSLYHYAHYYYEIARKNPEERDEYLQKSIKLYDALIKHQPLQLYQEEREKAASLYAAIVTKELG